MGEKKILVAMSGGVDSSVAAALLKKQGFQVEGLFVFFNQSKEMSASFKSAQAVVTKLTIPLHTLDLSQEFGKKIISDFIEEYKKGSTPNPCIRCNKYFKFGRLLDYAKQRGFDYLA